MKACLVSAICVIGVGAQPYTISTISGMDRGAEGIAATSILFGNIGGVAADLQGNVYFSDIAYGRVHRVSPDGLLLAMPTKTLAGWKSRVDDGGGGAERRPNIPTSAAAGWRTG